jgi:hypothetical protein
MLDGVVPFHPLDFFQVKMSTPPFEGKFVKGHLLPSLDDNSVAKVSLGWSASGLHILIDARYPLTEAQFPDFTRGDVVELMIDCRDNKQGYHLSRFCHHFACFNAPVEHEGKAVYGVEVTRFRGEDTHPLCSPEKIEVESFSNKKFSIFLPREILTGYDPAQFPRIGFSYIIKTHTELEQTFGASIEDFAVEQQPSVWSSIELIS